MASGKFVVIVPVEDLDNGDFSSTDDLFEIAGVTPDGAIVDSAGASGTTAGMMCIGLAAWNVQFVERLERLRARLEATQPFLPAVMALDGDKNCDALFYVASQGLGWLARRQAELVTQMSRDLGILRRHHEEMQNNFAAMEQFIANARLQKYEEAFVNEPDPGVFLEAPPPSETVIGVSQLLPVSSVNFCAVSIHIREESPRDNHVVALQLKTPEDGRVLARWSVTKKQLRRGWNRFALPRTSGGVARSLRLDIASHALPNLSLGPILPLPAYQVTEIDSAEPIADRALALRLMAALPGVKVVHDREAFMPCELPASDRVLQAEGEEYPLAPEALQHARFIALDGEESENNLVGVEGGATIRCRPRLGAPTIAFLPDACPMGATRVSCDVLLESARAEPVEFRIGWLAKGASLTPDLILGDGVIRARDRGCSDWLRVGPEQEMRLEAHGVAPQLAPGSIFLVTRMAEPNARPDHASARFRKFRFAGVRTHDGL